MTATSHVVQNSRGSGPMQFTGRDGATCSTFDFRIDFQVKNEKGTMFKDAVGEVSLSPALSRSRSPAPWTLDPEPWTLDPEP